jgi:O-antigen/teichoic acid export membrane protein
MIAEGGWLVGGTAGTALALLVGVRLLTEATPPSVYGEVGLLVGILNLGRNLFLAPLCTAAARFYSEVSRQGNLGILRRVVFRFLDRSNWFLSGIVIAVGAALSGGRSAALVHVALLAGMVVVDNLRVMEIELFLVARQQRAYAILRTIDAWLRPIMALLMVFCLGPTVTALLLGYFLAGTVSYGCLFVQWIERVGVAESCCVGPLEAADSEALADKVWSFGLPILPLAIMDWTSALGDRYLIGGLLGLESAGIYVAAYSLVALLFALIQGTVEQWMRPYYFEAVTSGDFRQSRKVFARWLVLLTSISLVVVVAVTLLRGTIMSLLLAEPYREAARLLPYLAVGHALWATSQTVEKVFHAQQRTKWCLVVRAAGAILSVAFAVPMILFHGMDGAAWAVPLYYGGQLSICVAVATRLKCYNDN